MLFWLWSPAGSQAFDGIVFGLQLVADPLLWVPAWGQPATDPVALTQELFVCAPRHPALIRVPAHPGFQVWAPRHV